MEKHNDLRFLLLFAVFAFAVFHIGSALKGFPLYRDQHIGSSVIYAKEGIDLFHPRIIGFNANDVATPQEFPIWQGLTGLVMRLGGAWLGWGNVVSIAIFLTVLWPVFQLANGVLGQRGAWWTCILFVLQPIVFYLCGMGAADGLALTVTLWFLYEAERMLRTGKWPHFCLATLFGVLCVLSKLPLFMMSGVALGIVLLVQHRASLRAWGQLGVVGLVSGLIFFAWTRHTDACIAQAVFPEVDLRISNPFTRQWYFGTWEYRLNPAVWLKAGWRSLSTLFGSFVLFIPFAGALYYRRHRLPQALLAGAIVTTLVFFKLVLTHRHYYTLYSLPVALLIAASIIWMEERVAGRSAFTRWLHSGAIGLGLLLATVQGLLSMEVVLCFDPYPKRIATIVREQLKPSDKAVIWGGGWGGEILMLADRPGLTVQDMRHLTESPDLKMLRQLGFNRVILISDSPLLWASQKMNPGQADLARTTYANPLKELSEEWPVLYRTDDIIILGIPKES